MNNIFSKNLKIIFAVLFTFSFVFNMHAKETIQKQKSYTILGIGDSITEGKGTNRSYLFPLWKKLFQAGFQVEFIGPNIHKCQIGNIMNAGFSGKNAEYLNNNINSIYSEYPADIILLHAGHNHFSSEKPVEGIIAAQKSIIKKIIAINSEAKIFVAQVVQSGKLPKYAYIVNLNKQISTMVKELRQKGFPVTLVNQSKKFNWKTHCNPDKVHPNNQGAELMANTWFNAIKKELVHITKPFSPEIVTYKEVDNFQLKLHIFEPEKIKRTKEKQATIIFFFAGGWSVGSPLQFYRECQYLASQGMVAISAEYRIKYLHNSKVKESVSDAKSAIRWLRNNANRYNIDTMRIAAAGSSAGGQIAAVAALINRFDEKTENQKTSSKPNLLLLYYPILDNSPDGFSTEDIKHNYHEISPFHNVEKYAPPILLVSGTKDPYFSAEKAKVFKQKTENNGGNCTLKLYEKAGHPIFQYRKGFSYNFYRLLDDSVSFLKQFGYLN